MRELVEIDKAIRLHLERKMGSHRNKGWHIPQAALCYGL